MKSDPEKGPVIQLLFPAKLISFRSLLSSVFFLEMRTRSDKVYPDVRVYESQLKKGVSPCFCFVQTGSEAVLLPY